MLSMVKDIYGFDCNQGVLSFFFFALFPLSFKIRLSEYFFSFLTVGKNKSLAIFVWQGD